MSEHWLQHAHGRIVAGDSEPDVLADYGWVQITDEERAAVERAIAEFAHHADRCRGDGSRAAILRGLLERLTTDA